VLFCGYCLLRSCRLAASQRRMKSWASDSEGSYAHWDSLNTFLAVAWRSFNSTINSKGYAVLDSSLCRAWDIAGESGSARPIPILPAQRMSFAKSSQLFFIAARRSFAASTNSVIPFLRINRAQPRMQKRAPLDLAPISVNEPNGTKSFLTHHRASCIRNEPIGFYVYVERDSTTTG
jgi:hypothetical protein